jgi:pimeloyl-ACP methyl ester carboxylesterase
MWTITGTDDQGTRREVRSKEIDRASHGDVYNAIREFTGDVPEALRREIETRDPLPGIDGIESWGETAAALSAGQFDYFPSYVPTNDGGSLPAIGLRQSESVAFHYPETLVVDTAGLRELEILALGSDLFGDTPSGIVMEGRAYGATTVAEFEHEAPTAAPTFRLSLPGQFRAAVVRFAQWVSRPFSSSEDPAMGGRLRHYIARYSAIAHRYPDIGAPKRGEFLALPPESAEAAIVFVHGTYSCAIPNLALLHPLKLPSYRFEHDTFRPVAANADDLTEAVRSLISRKTRVHLVAHSRGGLVSRLAALELSRPENPGRDASRDVRVLTFGTPHEGTPLANAGKRVLSALLGGGRTALLTAGGAAVNAVFSWDPPSLAGKLLLKGLSKFPEGLDDMRPQSGLIRGMGRMTNCDLQAWGAHCDLGNLHSGAFGLFLRDVVQGAFQGAANDSVVGVDSATAVGRKQPVLNACTHFEYFVRQDVRDTIQALS